MANTLLIQFDQHPAERDLIGKMILAYGELEIGVMNLLQAALGGDVTTAVRALYRLRSESNRLELADALVRPRLAEQKQDGDWQEAFDALKCCKKIRNHFAHGQFLNDSGQLRFGDLDLAAKSRGAESKIQMRPISLGVLKSQWAYFEYTHHQVLWIADKYRATTGQPRLIDGKVPKPKKVRPPSLDSRQ